MGNTLDTEKGIKLTEAQLEQLRINLEANGQLPGDGLVLTSHALSLLNALKIVQADQEKSAPPPAPSKP